MKDFPLRFWTASSASCIYYLTKALLSDKELTFAFSNSTNPKPVDNVLFVNVRYVSFQNKPVMTRQSMIRP